MEKNNNNKDLRAQLLAVFEAVLAQQGNMPRSAIVFATGMADRDVKLALAALQAAELIECDADYGQCRDSGRCSQILASKAAKMRAEADNTDMFLTHESLVDLRKRLGWTQQQAADYVGVPRSTYSLYELGSRQPDRSILSKLTTALKNDVTNVVIVASPKGLTKTPKI